MTKKPIDWVLAYERDLIEKDAARDTMLRYIKKMARTDWEFPAAFKLARPDVRTIRDSTPADAVENASITLSNTHPLWQVKPYSSNIAEYMRTEKLEEVIRCSYRKSNQRGIGTVLFDKARSSILYNMSATRTDDLAQILPKSKSKWTNLQREAWSSGRFIYTPYEPIAVHVEVSPMGTVALCVEEYRRAWDVRRYWEMYADDTAEGKMVQEGLRRMKEKMDEAEGKKKGSSRGMVFIERYFITHEQIARHGRFAADGMALGVPVSGAYQDNVTGDEIIFVDQENAAGFIPWSVRMGGSRIESDPKYQLNPMLAQLYYSNVWETVNIIQSIVLSKPIAELERANEIQYTIDGQRLPENDGVMIGRQGDRVERPPFPQIDPNAFGVVDRLLQSIVRSTGASQLGDINAAKGAAYASLNAVLQVIMGRLDVQRRDIALSCADDVINSLKWVEHNKVPWTGHREQDAKMYGRPVQRGDMIAVTADDFDAYEMDLICDIKPRTPTDFQQQVLTAIQLHDKSPLPWRELLQHLGYENTELLKQQRILEDHEDAEVRAEIDAIMAKRGIIAQAEGQMEARQLMQGGGGAPPGGAPQGPPQQPMTGMPNAGGGLSETAFGPLGNTGMQGMNPAGGGSPASMFQPQLTREAVSGMDKAGRSVA